MCSKYKLKYICKKNESMYIHIYSLYIYILIDIDLTVDCGRTESGQLLFSPSMSTVHCKSTAEGSKLCVKSTVNILYYCSQ